MNLETIFCHDDPGALPIGGRQSPECGLCARAARVAALGTGQMAAGLLFLAAFAPAVCDEVLKAAEAEPVHQMPRVGLDPEPEDDCGYIEGDREAYCRACEMPAARFTSYGGEWTHYTGDPLHGMLEPYTENHKPVLGWRPAMGLPEPMAA